MKAIDFLKDDLTEVYLKIAIPALLGIVINLFYGFVDGVFIGKYISVEALSGVTIIFPLTMIALAVVSMIGEGCGSTLSRAIAKKDMDRCKVLIQTSHGAVFWLMIVALIGTFLNLSKLVYALGALDVIASYSKAYLAITMIGWPFMGLSLIYFHQLNAQGATRLATMAMFVSTLLNIILDYIFIVVFKWGVEGAASATVIAQVVWYLVMHVMAVKRESVLTIVNSITLKINLEVLKEEVIMGFGSFVRQVGVAVALLVINMYAGKYNALHHIAAFGASQRILRLSLAPIIAISIAFKPIAGQNFGGGHYARIRKALKLGIVITALMGLVLLIGLYTFRTQMGTLFGVGQSETFTFVFTMTILLLPLFGIQHIVVAFFVSIGHAKPAICINFSKQFLILLPLIVVLAHYFGIVGIFLAVPIADFLGTIISLMYLRWGIKIIA